MGAIEIVEKIKEEAKAEGEKIIKEAEEQAEEIIENAKKEIEKNKKELIRDEEKKAATEKDRIIRAARLNARKKKWKAQEEMIKEALENAKKKLKEIKKEGFKGETYKDILAGLIKESALSIRGGSSEEDVNELEVLLSEEDAEASYVDNAVLDKIAKETLSNISFSEERVKGDGGVIVRRKDGKIEVNNTFEKRIERHYSSLREKAMKALFKTEQ